MRLFKITGSPSVDGLRFEVADAASDEEVAENAHWAVEQHLGYGWQELPDKLCKLKATWEMTDESQFDIPDDVRHALLRLALEEDGGREVQNTDHLDELMKNIAPENKEPK